MTDRESTLKGLTEISEYMRAKADIAGIGKGKEVFDSWYRAAEDALDLLREQEPEIVLCKDYKHYDPDTQSCNDGLDGIFLPDWFCADGERR